MVDRVGAPYRVLLYQPGIRFIHLSNSKGLCLQHSRAFHQCVLSQFNRNNILYINKTNANLANILRTPPSILSKPSKSILAKSKFYLKTKSFVQATKDNTKNILKIKKIFSKLSNSKIIKIHNIAYKNDQKAKSKINMTIKELLRKKIIILMSRENINVIVSDINAYIANINRLLKFIKSDVSANFICYDNKDVIITTNKMAIIVMRHFEH